MNEEQTLNNNSLEMRLQELNLEFQTIESQINKIVNESNEKIAEYKQLINEIYKQGQSEVDKLMTRREQVRGAYTELLKIVHPEISQVQPVDVKSTTIENTDEVKSETPEEQTIETRNIDVKPDNEQHKKEKSKQNKALTQEEIDKISKQFNNISDVPDYLQEEYNK